MIAFPAMRHVFAQTFGAMAFAGIVAAAAASTDLGPPPPTRRVDASDTRFGRTIPDPYRWLEASDPAEVHNWIQLQNAYADKYFAGAAATELRQRISDLASASPPRSVPKIAHGRIFFLQRRESDQRASLLITSMLGGEATVLAEPGKDASTIVDFWPAPGGRYVAVAKAASGRESISIDVYDLANKRVYETIAESANVSTPTLAWDADESGFYYIRSPTRSEKGSARLDAAVYHHVLGKGFKADVLSFSRGISPLVELRPPTAEFELIGGSGGRVALFSSVGDNPFNAVHLHNGSTWRRIADESASINAGVWVKDRLLLLATGISPRGHVLGVSPDGKISELVPQGDSVIHGIAPFGDGFLLTRSSGFDWKVEHYAQDGSLIRTLDLPQHDIGIDGVGSEIGNGAAIIAYSGWITPSRWARYEGSDGSLHSLFEAKAIGDLAKVSIHHLTAVSEDSTSIPITLFTRSDVSAGQKTPTILFVYGAFGIVLRPHFLGTRLAWIEKGGSYAQAIIRGGGEFGESWHEQGSKLNKIKGAQDMFAATRLLIEQHWTDSEHMGLEGQSAGGIMIGIGITQHPELYRAAASRVGIYDLLRNETFPSGRFTAGELGSVNDQEQFAAMLKYSPLQHVEAGAQYPAVLIQTANMDELVAPWQSRKFAAALQNATGSGRPVLLHTRLDAGHSGSASLAQVIDDQKQVLSFFAKELGLSLSEQRDPSELSTSR